MSLLGAVFGATQHHYLFRAATVAPLVGVVGVGSLVISCMPLGSEKRIAVRNLVEEGGIVRRKYDEYLLRAVR